MTKEEKIAKIYSIIADKTLSFGCWCIVEKFVSKRQICSMVYQDDKNDMDYFYTKEKGNVYIQDVIGHPVMIGDVLDYIDSIEFNHPNDFIKWHKEKYPIIMDTLFTDWEEKRKPIEEQSEETIDFVFNLLPKE